MILCLDFGNSHLYGGAFVNDKLLLRFRHTTQLATSDELGIFLKSVLRENDIDNNQVQQIALCSVVPYLDYSLRSACKKYFNVEPFVLQAGVKTGLKIKYRNPLEVGADRIANAIAAINGYPQQNIIIVDFGTATTFCVISADKEYLGGVILPGVRLAMDALQSKTAKLPPVEIIKPQTTVGRSTIESIQSGLYYGTVGAVKQVIDRIQQQTFSDKPAIVLATGGFVNLFSEENLFTANVPDLVLQGLKIALRLNQS